MAGGLLSSLFHHASAHGSRSTALNPLIWAFGMVLSSLVASKKANAPEGVIVLLCVFASFILAILLFAFVYLMLKQPDALRSEKFTLSKMVIEKSIMGDSLKGFTKLSLDDENVLSATVDTGEEAELR